jgi:hypothetical protein
LLSSDGRAKDEASIREYLPPYAEIYDTSLAQRGDAMHAIDAVRKQLHRDVEALAGAGITVEVDGTQEGRLYRLPPTGFSPVEVDLKAEERAVLVGALRALRRDFPYAGPLRLALANLISTASVGSLQGGYEDEENRVTLAAVATRDDEAVAMRVATLESAVSRRKRVRFDYYSISRDEVLRREVEPYTLSLLDGSWYLNARIGVSAAPTQLFKEQRDALAILRSNLKHPTVAREDSVELTRVVRRPLARTLRRELRDILNDYEGNGDHDGLVTELLSFVGRYGLHSEASDGATTNGSSKKEITEEELELIAYLDLS